MMTDLLQQLNATDTSVFLFFNGIHSPYWDHFMSAFTGKLIWVPMYAAILYLLLRNYHWKTAVCCLVAIGLTIAFADQMCNSILRPAIGRLRPSAEGSPIADLCHIVNGRRGGGFGFPSCHASNSFGLALMVFYLFRQKSLTVFIFCWAFMNSYTRLYLGLHYPGDLLAGAIVGMIGASLFYLLLTQIPLYKRRLQPVQTAIPIYAGGILCTGILVYSFF